MRSNSAYLLKKKKKKKKKKQKQHTEAVTFTGVGPKPSLFSPIPIFKQKPIIQKMLRSAYIGHFP
jgi:hypothetical protein